MAENKIQNIDVKLSDFHLKSNRMASGDLIGLKLTYSKFRSLQKSVTSAPFLSKGRTLTEVEKKVEIARQRQLSKATKHRKMAFLC